MALHERGLRLLWVEPGNESLVPCSGAPFRVHLSATSPENVNFVRIHAYHTDFGMCGCVGLPDDCRPGWCLTQQVRMDDFTFGDEPVAVERPSWGRVKVMYR